MAQLPPKFPSNITPSTWPSFPHHPRLPSMASFNLCPLPTAPTVSTTWADEFFDFSLSKRASHRRAISDSIAFFESASVPPDDSQAVAAVANFDGLDEEQLMSMFSDDPQPPSSAPPSTTPSTPSDHNSISNHDKQTPPNFSGNDPSEAQSASNAELALAAAAVSATITTPEQKTSQPIADLKRVKRILANRQSAQRSRVRKLQYISELQKSVDTLQTEVSALSPRVAFLDRQRSALSVGNCQLKQRIAALAQDKIFKDAHQEALQNELERLRQVYRRQSLKKMAAPAVAGGKSDVPAIAADKEVNIQAGTDPAPNIER
ncbi:hypothetical protein IEQ34_003796 [Dendrobium chrysotoxum]|uniref:BZIP domain-containing protein n=1 Tax=Dendrobium chrysotoxum TaxID=161865 RepID=A0AAV7HER0_DENCH|nr:hypothetical protein IEQ34_003796 [Dendrobium chrysotoxum]